jgi:hypothetical protein
VVSTCSCRLRNSTPRSTRPVMVSTRWRSDRPSRSSFQTTRRGRVDPPDGRWCGEAAVSAFLG